MRATHPSRRTAVVAGASSGIGAATALALADAGHPVALGARRVERCQELVDRIRDAGGEALAHALDVTSAESVESFAAKVVAELGDVEVVVSNAGGVTPGAIAESSTDRFAEELDLTVLGAHRLVRAFLPAMLARQRGDVVFVSSDVAVRARPFVSGYAAGKWGLEGMVSALQLELEGSGVRASVVRPGPTQSEMGSDWDAAEGGRTIEAWARAGFARHGGFLPAAAIAEAIALVVGAPRGTHLSLVEVNPEAPVEGT